MFFIEIMESEQEPKEILADSTDTQVLPPIKYGEPEPADVILVVEGQEYHVQKMVSLFLLFLNCLL